VCYRGVFFSTGLSRPSSFRIAIGLLQSVAVCCSVLQYVAVCCSTLLLSCNRSFFSFSETLFVQYCEVSQTDSVLQCVAVCCSVLQCVAVCCSVLQCVAVCCSVLQ